MTVQCCVCRKYRVDNDWKKKTDVETDISHTYCPPSKEKAFDSILADREASAAAK